MIFCIWHNRLSLSLVLFHRFFRDNRTGLAALVSASKDGGLFARILELFEAVPVRGSTSRRGPQALLELKSWAERRYDIAITPDGPRGPGYQVQPGIIGLAQVTGQSIVPISFYLSRKIQLKSWDRFQIPLPFSRCEIQLGKFIAVPRDATDEQRENLRRELQREMVAITRD